MFIIWNTLDGIKSRLDTPIEKISELEDVAISMTQKETHRKKVWK